MFEKLKDSIKEQERQKKYSSGKYIAGHPEITSPIDATNYEIANSELLIFPIIPARGFTAAHLGEAAGIIPISQIVHVAVEDASTSEKRVTATRILALGIFALAAKKKDIHAKFYATISWGGGIRNDTIFEFEGKDAQRSATSFRDAIVKAVNTFLQST
jgi:hypothetical protein